MPTTVVTKVWIEPGCIACEACTTTCPKVFARRRETCVIRPEALDAAFTRPRSLEIMDAAEECPVEVIKVETMQVQVGETPDGQVVSRRGVLSAAGVGWLAVGGTVVLSGLAAQRFLFPNVLAEPDPRIRLGELDSYAEMPSRSVSEAFKSQGIWIVRLPGRIAAHSTTCTHRGCLTNWVEGERKFKCPCHGSGFGQDGTNVEGPAPRSLERLKIWLQDGVIMVDRSKRFLRERGQWHDPESFVSI